MLAYFVWRQVRWIPYSPLCSSFFGFGDLLLWGEAIFLIYSPPKCPIPVSFLPRLKARVLVDLVRFLRPPLSSPLRPSRASYFFSCDLRLTILIVLVLHHSRQKSGQECPPHIKWRDLFHTHTSLSEHVSNSHRKTPCELEAEISPNLVFVQGIIEAHEVCACGCVLQSASAALKRWINQ